MMLRLLLPFICLSSVPALAEPVKLLVLDWSSQQVITRALGSVLQDKGVKVEYVEVSSGAQWYQLAHGKADIQVEVWQGSMGTKFNELVAQGIIREGVTHSAKTREDWWYPLYVEEDCPGLPNWEALRSCSSLFAEGEGDKGAFFSGPWEKADSARIRALGLNFEVIVLSDGNAINEKIDQYISEHRPLLVYNWTPNWVEAKYAGRFVEFPPYDVACESEPSWGLNPKYTWDCGNPSDGWLKTAVSTSLVMKSKCAYDIVSVFKLTSEHIAHAALLADRYNLSIEQAAARWVQDYQHDISLWTEHKSCLSN